MNPINPMNRYPRQQGYILFLLLPALLVLSLFLLFLFNTGSILTQRIQLQNTADAAAYTQATWIAYTLNRMATHNRALVQVFADVALHSALQDTLTEARALAKAKAQDYRRQRERCERQPTAKQEECRDKYQDRLDDLEDEVLEPLADLATLPSADIVRKQTATGQALAAANEQLVSGFAAFSAGVQNELAYHNRLAPEDLRLFAPAFAAKDPVATGLPVAPATSGTSAGSLCAIGEQDAFPTGLATLDERLASPLAALAADPHEIELDTSFADRAMALWRESCASHTLNGTDLTVYGIPDKRQHPVTPLARQDWSLLAFTRDRMPLLLGADFFSHPAEGFYASAQAEVFNPQGYDLWTPHWQARLAPTRLLGMAQRDELLAAVTTFAPLATWLSTLSASERELLHDH